MRNNRPALLWAISYACLSLGCVEQNTGHDAGHGAVADSGDDAGQVDAGGVDAGGVDAGGVDAGGVDAGEVDAGEVDAGPVCSPVADEDADGDGFTPAGGDCDDCDAEVNPRAMELPGNEVDDDCDDVFDEVPPPCDEALPVDSNDALQAARALGVCDSPTASRGFGVSNARWVRANGEVVDDTIAARFHLGHGLLDRFGVSVPGEGSRLLALSNGVARTPDTTGYASNFNTDYAGQWPPGFPKESAACPGVSPGRLRDDVALELTLRVPTNAHSLSFDHRTFLGDWPSFVCSAAMDGFLALLSPVPDGQFDGNLVFDGTGAPIQAASAFVDVCSCVGHPGSACVAGGQTFACAAGDLALAGTGFEKSPQRFTAAAGTRWLRTTAPVVPGSEVQLRFAVFDVSDGILDLTTLIDGLTFHTAEAAASVTRAIEETPATCGNGQLDEGERCEGIDFPASCEALGFARGETACTNACVPVVAACVPREGCAQFTDLDGDGATGCDDSECTDHPACATACSGAIPLVEGQLAFASFRGRPDRFTASCGAASQREATFRFVAPRAGGVAVTVAGSESTVTASLHRASCSATALACTEIARFESFTFPATVAAGDVLGLVVEGAAGDSVNVVVRY